MADPFIVSVDPANTGLIEQAVHAAKAAGSLQTNDAILGELLALGAFEVVLRAKAAGSVLNAVRGALN